VPPHSLTDLAGLRVSAEDFLAAVLESAAQPIWVVDPEGRIRFANPAAIAALRSALLGTPREADARGASMWAVAGCDGVCRPEGALVDDRQRVFPGWRRRCVAGGS
jgi:PAS domain-containing protein